MEKQKLKIKSYSVKTLMKMEKTTFEKQVQQLRNDYSNQNRFKQMKHNQKSKSKQVKPPTIQTIGNFLQPTKIISLTAPKWSIFDFYTATYLRGYRSHDPHPLGNFSKLLVFCTINALIIKHKIDTTRFDVIVSKSTIKWANKQSLKVAQDNIINLEDMLHLMMMQEDECYELILGCNVGAYLQKKQKKQYYSVYDSNDKSFNEDLRNFYTLVNTYSKFLNLNNVKYIEHDPALRTQKNVCCAYDIAQLSVECLKIPLFMQILQKKQHKVKANYIDQQGHLKVRQFKIYNKTVSNPYISYFNVSRNWQPNQFMSSNCSVYYDDKVTRPIVLVLLGAYSPNDREKDIQQVVQWYLKNKNIKSSEENKNNISNLQLLKNSGILLKPEPLNLRHQKAIKSKLISNYSMRTKTQI